MSVEPNYSTFCPLTTLEGLNETLKEHGVAVLPDVITANECDLVRQKVYEHLKVKLDVEKPDDYLKLGGYRGVIMKTYGIALRPEILELKTDERVVEPFRRIWGEEDLTTSFDSITIEGPPEQKAARPFFDIQDTWFHTDQSSQKQSLCCVQSFINLEETGDGDGCLSVLLNSHNYHQEFFKTFGLDTRGDDWFLLNKTTHHDWYTKQKACKWAMISAPKGSMVFWDSRTIHMGTAPRMGRPNPDRWRFIAYVCYTPARLQTKEDVRLKRTAFLNNLTTSHWPYGVKVEKSNENEPRRNDLRALSMRQRRLFGVE